MGIKYTYYEVLDVSRTATFAQVKKAYREKAKESHPDRNPGCKKSEERFKIVNEAYQALSEPESRRAYDKKLENNGRISFSINDFYTELGSEFSGESVEMEVVVVELEIEDAFYGCEREVSYGVPVVCEGCNGTGAEEGKVRKCPPCEGKGYFVREEGWVQFERDCGHCEGKGYFYVSGCKACQERGYTFEKKTAKVALPAGLADGNKVTLSTGEGVEVLLDVRVSNKSKFMRQGYDIYFKMDVQLRDMLLGADLQLDRFGEILSIKVPRRSKHKDLVALKGMGFEELGSSDRGDLVVELNMVYPEIDQRTEALIKRL